MVDIAFSSTTEQELAALRGDLVDAKREIDDLRIALDSSRRIGAAIGILMERRKITYEAAFSRILAASHLTNTKVRELADELLHTGTDPAA